MKQIVFALFETFRVEKLSRLRLRKYALDTKNSFSFNTGVVVVVIVVVIAVTVIVHVVVTLPVITERERERERYLIALFKKAQSRPLFVYFCSFNMTNIAQILL